MARVRVRGWIAGLATAVVFGGLILALGPAPQGSAEPQQPAPARKPRPEGKPIAMSPNLVGLEIDLGLKDEQPTPWGGDLQVSEGQIRELEILRPRGANAKVEGNRFTVRTVQRMQGMQQVLIRPALRVTLDAPASAKVTVNTRQGNFTFALADLTTGTPRKFLDGRASVERQEASLRLSTADTEDDFPVLARGPDGTYWLAYVEYQPGPPIIPERLQAGEFDTLVPKGNGDQIRLIHFDGKVWQPAVDVTDAGLDVWRPTVTVDGKGVVWVAWSQQVDGDWEIFHRRFTPPGKDNAKGQWSDIVRVTNSPGADFHVVAATDAKGVVWLAWQSWRNDNFDIVLAAMADGHPWSRPRVISNSKANDWSPAIAADAKGNVYVAWDTYDKGNYDVRLFSTGTEKVTDVANSPRFEARPSLACDAQDRLWIAYEEGDEQWGKDYVGDHVKKIPLPKNPGYALYVNRTVQVKCLVNGKLMEPAGKLADAFKGKLSRGKSVPRLLADAGGGVWLFLRHHPLPGGAGEVWDSYALRYNGKRWSAPRHLPASANLMDNRPALAPFGQGVLTVYSGDHRQNTQSHVKDDLYAMVLLPGGPTSQPELEAAAATPPAQLQPVHPHEPADVTRMRNYRVEVGGKKLHLWRGEFHRHTEYTAHRDQDGLLEDAWRYALDASDLDWIGVGDHDNGFGVEYFWWQFQKVTDLFHNPPRFVGVYTYERSVVYPNGHRNVILPQRGVRPLPRGELPGTPEKGSPDTKRLYAYLKHFGGICASHTSATNMGTDWRDNDPVVEPVVEIYQGHRHNYEAMGAPRAPSQRRQVGGFQPAGYVWNAFDKGYRLGFQSSSDHISTHMSYAVVLTADVSRQGIIDAFKKRHSYAATDNIILDVRSGDHIMGDEFETEERPTLDIRVQGTGPVARLHVIRDDEYVYSVEPKKAEVKIQYTDMDPEAGTAYYYVRVEQEDGNLAWASPMWIKYKPKKK